MPTFKSPHPLLDIPNVSLPHFVTSNAPEDPDVAIFHAADVEAKDLSFKQVLGVARRIAAGLRGLKWWAASETKCVCLYAPNHPAYVAVALGVQAAGGICATANPAYGPDELEHQLKDSGAEVVVTIPGKNEEVARSVLGRLLPQHHSLVDRMRSLTHSDPDPTEDRVWVFDDKAANSILKFGAEDESSLHSDVESGSKDWSQEVAFLCYSSGTSGRPKGVKLSHRNLIANILQNEFMLGESFGKGQHHIDVLPMFHCYGLVMAFLALKKGVPRHLFARFNLEKYLQTIQDNKVTFGFVAPPMLLGLAKSPLTKKYNIESLQRVASGAAPLSEGLRKHAKEVLGFVVTDGYGATEMSPVIAVQTPADVEPAPLSIGHLAPNVELRVVDDDGKELGAGETGELLVNGPNRMIGYNHNEEANAEAFTDDGFLRTGDIGKIDDRGYVYITDRKKDLIKYHGYQVSVAELESVLISHPSVSDAAVVPLHAESQATELPYAFVVAAPDVDKTDGELDKIKEFVNGKVAFFKKLRGGAEWIDAIPKNASGKVLHKDLRAKLRERHPNA